MIIIPGESSTGTPHSIGLERTDKGIKFVVLGADGKKRHATVHLTLTMAEMLGGLTTTLVVESR